MERDRELDGRAWEWEWRVGGGEWGGGDLLMVAVCCNGQPRARFGEEGNGAREEGERC